MNKFHIVEDPVLPESYRPEMRDGDFEAHGQLARTTLDEFTAGMTELSVFDGGDWEAKYVDIRGDDEGGSDKAILMPLPFGNGYSPAMHIRVETMRRMLPEDVRVLVFPNNSGSEKTHTPFVEHEVNRDRNAVHMLARRVLTIAENLGVEHAATVGYSQGASVGAALLRINGERNMLNTSASSAMLVEPANVFDQTPKQLKKRMMKSGIGPLNRAINDSNIPALSETQHSRGGADAVRQLYGFATDVRKGAADPVNQELHVAMAKEHFTADILAAEKRDVLHFGTLVAFMGASTLTAGLDTDGLNQILTDAGLGQSEMVEGYGHEGGDNVILHALMARKALERSLFFGQSS